MVSGVACRVEIDAAQQCDKKFTKKGHIMFFFSGKAGAVTSLRQHKGSGDVIDAIFSKVIRTLGNVSRFRELSVSRRLCRVPTRLYLVQVSARPQDFITITKTWKNVIV